MIELRNWTLCSGGDEYTPPEYRPLCVGGQVDYHPVLGACPEGSKLVSSPIVRVEGNVVETKSGSRYKLMGPPDSFFIESVLGKHGLKFNGDLEAIVAYLAFQGPRPE